MKQCYRCKKILPTEAFYKPKNRKHESWCRECKKQWQKEYNASKAKGIDHNAPLASDEAIDKWLKENPILRKPLVAAFANVHNDIIRG